MPYPLSFLDPDGNAFIQDAFTTKPLTVGTDFRAGDERFVWYMVQTATVVSVSAGWTKVAEVATGGERLSLFKSVLTDTSVDGVVTFSAAQYVHYVAVTVRNPNLGQTLSPSTVSGSAAGSVAPSVTVNDGTLLTFHALAGTTDMTGPPPGMTQLVAVSTHGVAGASFLLCAQSYISAGTSGTKTAPGPSGTYWATSLFLATNPDVSETAGTAVAEVDAANAVTGTLLNSVSFICNSADPEIDIANQAFTPLDGYRISPALVLPTDPVYASVVSWTQSPDYPGSSVLVETSIDNGVSWQLAVNNGPIPRLKPGTNVIRTFLSRVTIHRANVLDPTPWCGPLEVRVSTDASTNEMCPLGVFVITESTVTQSSDPQAGGVTVQLAGVDRSELISQYKWEDLYIVPDGITVDAAIALIVLNRLPGCELNFTSTPHLTNRLLLGTSQGSDPWQDAQDLATSIGFELFFDARGICVLRPVPDPAIGAAQWEFSTATNPTIVEASKKLTVAATYNIVIAQGESSGDDAPVSATAYNDDPASPTYWLGKFGKRTVYFTSPMLKTVQQCQDAADALINLVKGASENADLQVVPNPALEPGDIVAITVNGAKIIGRFLINQMTTPMGVGVGGGGTGLTQSINAFRQN